MNAQQWMAFGVLGATLVMFVWARWRYDVVAVLALLAVVALGLVPPQDAFAGFGHPAVITIAAVLIISRGLQNAGLVDVVAQAIAPLRGRELLQLGALCVVIAFLSSFMNNVGALALMLPVAMRMAYRDGYPPAKTLMPLAFASLLGGLTTLIGTPPNLIVSGFRAQEAGGAFGMFDFTPVGIAVAVAGIAFLVAVGWRLIPLEGRRGDEGKAFEMKGYVTEAEVAENSKAAGMTIFEIEALAEDDVTIVGLIRDKVRRLVPSGYQRFQVGDILVLRGDTDSLKATVDAAGLALVGDKDIGRDDLKSEDIDVVECVVSPDSVLIGRTPVSARLRTIHGVNLLALARQGHGIHQRLNSIEFQAGDVLLLQGPSAEMPEILTRLDCLPLAARSLGIGRQRRLVLAGGMFAAAVALTVANVLPVQIAFAAAAAGYVMTNIVRPGYVMTNIVRPGELYSSIDWPVIVLIGALFPLGHALESTGGTSLVADAILSFSQGLGPAWVLLILLVATMCISDMINNNATAILMAPIAVTLASRLGVNADPFLMAVALGASCAFLTPIGHQSNTLVMQPGGYKFGDYWRVGLPLEIVIVAVGMPAILLVWPL